MPRISSIALLTLAVLGCASVANKRAAIDEDQAVFRAVLEHECAAAPRYFVLSQTPLSRKFISDYLAPEVAHFFGLDANDPALQDLMRRAERMERKVSPPHECPGLRPERRSDAQVDTSPMFAGRIALSLPGYSADRNRAVVMSDWYMGVLSSATSLIELAKDQGHWKIVKVHQLRVS